MSKSNKKYKGFPCKLNSDQIYRGISYIIFRGPINLLEIYHLNLKRFQYFTVFAPIKLKEGTPPYPRTAGPRAWWDAWGEPRQENQKTEIRKRTVKEIEKERKTSKTNAISYLQFQVLKESYFFLKLFPYLKRILRVDFFYE